MNQNTSRPAVLLDVALDDAGAEQGCTLQAFARLRDPLRPQMHGEPILRLGLSWRSAAEPRWRRLVVRRGEQVIFDGPSFGATTLAWRLPVEALAQLPDQSLVIEQPDLEAGEPWGLHIDSVRLLSPPGRPPSARKREPGSALTDKAVATCFESLGDNCEFGIFQRCCEAEPLGLLRFSSARLDKLLIGLETGFAGVQARDQIESFLAGPDGGPFEYLMIQNTFRMVYHTGVFEGQLTPRQLHARELTRLQYLRRKLVEDMEDAEKIFVCRRMPPLSEPEMLPIWLALQDYGPNTLLWVAPATPEHPAGSVERIGDRLMRGYLDRLATYDNATDVSVASWLAVCRQALQLHELED